MSRKTNNILVVVVGVLALLLGSAGINYLTGEVLALGDTRYGVNFIWGWMLGMIVGSLGIIFWRGKYE